jgi:hypothetical protein
MNTVENEVCVGLAYVYAKENGMSENTAWRWAKQHWLDFVDEIDSDTGKVLQQMDDYRRRNEPR